MAKAKTKTLVSSERAQYLGVVKEAFEDSMRVVKEQYVDLKKDNTEIKQNIARIDRKLESHSEMIGKIMTQLEEVKDGLRAKVDYSDFAKLEKRVVYLETRMARA